MDGGKRRSVLGCRPPSDSRKIVVVCGDRLLQPQRDIAPFASGYLDKLFCSSFVVGITNNSGEMDKNAPIAGGIQRTRG